MTHALLVTDVVDSTQLAEQLGDVATAALWARHDRVARDLLPVHRGREIDKTDGFLLLFDRARDAVAYAVAYHRAIAALEPPLKARAGLHVGEVVLTENAPDDVARGAKPLEVDGLAKPVAARIMSVASGGQTLLSAPARAALGDTSWRVTSHGHWRMKGVAEPVELFEARDADAPMTPPPDAAKVWRVVARDGLWLPVREVQHQLPYERDAFVGRASDLRSLAELLDASRLVSVLGIGGTGKTRLVTHFAWTWLGDYPGGAWFCDLSEARAVDGICDAVAATLGVPLGSGDPVLQLGHAIAGRGDCLVILDNFEQVGRFAQETVGRWLDRARDARFVVTTRDVLGLPGESTLPLAPLADEDSFRLFVARARQAKPDFVAEDEASIRALVALLDHLPLAIELAAARVRLMPPRTLLARMSERFKLLSSAGAGRRTRQATLRGALDWSWELLSEDERTALAQLSVFEGGFTLEAAEGVLALADLWPMDAVQALVDRSWVRRVTDERFDLLVSVQEYAAEKLEALGQRAETEGRHAAWFAQLGSKESLAALNRHGGAPLLQALAGELANVVAACQRCVHAGDELAVPLLRAAWEVVSMRGPLARGLDLATRVHRMPSLSPAASETATDLLCQALQANARGAETLPLLDAALATALATGDRPGEALARSRRATIHQAMGRIDEAREGFEAALAIDRELHPDGSSRAEMLTLHSLGNLLREGGRFEESDPLYQRALTIARRHGDRRFEGTILGSLAGQLHERSRLSEARPYYEAALAVHREVGSRKLEGSVLGNLGLLLAVQGRADEARQMLDAALIVHREVGDRRFEAFVHASLGILHAGIQDWPVARAQFEAALAIHREVGNRRFVGTTLGNLANVQRAQGELDLARENLEKALAIHREVGNRRFAGLVLGNLASLDLAQGHLDRAREHLGQSLELLREVDDRLEQARVLATRARLEVVEGRLEDARATLAEALGLAASVGAADDATLEDSLIPVREALAAPGAGSQ